MTKTKSGQASVEYLMTYGWAILVLLIAGVVIWQMGLLDLGKPSTPGKRGFAQITPLDWGLDTGGKLTVVLTNEGGTILNLTQVDATIISGGIGECTTGVTLSDGEKMRPAATYTAEVTNCPITEQRGEYYRVNLTVRYINPSSGLPHVSNGLVWGPLE